jgi:hypothetical protein
LAGLEIWPMLYQPIRVDGPTSNRNTGAGVPLKRSNFARFTPRIAAKAQSRGCNIAARALSASILYSLPPAVDQ